VNFQEAIKAKDDAIVGYAAHPDGLWPLVLAEAGEAAQDLELTQEAEAWAHATRFDRAFFLGSRNKVSDLRLVQRLHPRWPRAPRRRPSYAASEPARA
jgi:hypothetical protein